MRYGNLSQRLLDSVLHTPGHAAADLRRMVLERAKQTRGAGSDLPAALGHYVDNVAKHAYKVTDADVAKLKQAGHSDDALFEITVAAAVGAAMHRLERGMAALHGQEPD